MNARTSVAGLLVAGGLMLASCSAQTPPPPTPSVDAAGPISTPTATATPSPTSTKSPRGNLTKAVNEPFGFHDKTTSDPLGQFVVTSIAVDPACTNEYASPPEHGHFVRLDLQGETASALPDDLYFAGGTWSVIAENGTTFNGDPWNTASNSCLQGVERLPAVVGPGEKVNGSVVLDVPTAHGVVVWSPFGDGGFEWTY